MKAFEVKDCALLRRMSGLPPAFNLRELRDRIALCSPDVLYHHFCETLLVPSFDYPDFRSDVAVWVKRKLDEDVLAERLGIIDPYRFDSMEDLRKTVLDMVEERLNELSFIPSVAQGQEFYFLEATTIVFDTGLRIRRPREMAAAVGRMTHGSIYYHFLEARRRPPAGMDDFSAWLQDAREDPSKMIGALSEIDYAFFTLKELQRELVRVLTGGEVGT